MGLPLRLPHRLHHQPHWALQRKDWLSVSSSCPLEPLAPHGWDTSLRMQQQNFLRLPSSMVRSAWSHTQAGPRCFSSSWSEARYAGNCQIGTNFNWTLNQEIVFSAALTGKPLRKQEFQQYCWKRCVIGASRDCAP